MFNFLSFLSPYKWLALGIAAALLFGYIGFLNLRINYLKSDNAKLEAKNVLWQSTVEILSNSVQTQNDALENVRKQAESARQAATGALSKAKQANTIRQAKINAATARIVIENPSECSQAIDAAKKELSP